MNLIRCLMKTNKIVVTILKIVGYVVTALIAYFEGSDNILSGLF